MSSNVILKKIVKITASVVLYAFLAVCLLGVVLTVTSKRDSDGTSSIFGMQMRVVLSPSMEKCEATDVSGFEIKDIPTGSMVFIETVPDDAAAAKKWYEDLEVGDVLTFKYVYTKQETITHRITYMTPKNDGFIIGLEGDNKASDSSTLTQVINTNVENSPNYVVGKVVGQSYLLGLLVSALRSPVGLVLIIILPALAVIIFEVIRIVNIFTATKRQKEEEEHKARQNELEELKRRLAELEAQSAAPTTNVNNGTEP